MAKLKLRGKDLRNIGYPESPVISIAIGVMELHYKHHSQEDALAVLSKVLASPQDYVNDEVLGKIAERLVEKQEQEARALRDNGIKYAVYGAEFIDPSAIRQMEQAVRLPVAVAGALMPDAHHGYGLPIGGVLATGNAVIPYGVGVDIGCRMCLSILDLPVKSQQAEYNKYVKVLTDHTKFGAGAAWKHTPDAEVLERKEFEELPLLKFLHDKAVGQLGTSGSGNHFVEWGVVHIQDAQNEWGLMPGEYTAILSHSGSRGLGAQVAGHYTRLAKELCPLPKEVQHLAWLDLNSEAGQEYWLSMNLAGDYASACHHLIHERLVKAMGAEVLARVENHHNFAWKETHEGKEMIVHRKGATPAGKGVMGIIPGSMTAPGYIVRGRGEAASLDSASHGAGRAMSRTAATQSITRHAMDKMLRDHGVTLIGGGLDEAPMAYKNINEVMSAQTDLVEVLARFQPTIVRMADGE
ncbi:RtcB family protein [Chitinophaga horti]|uniref:3'-phosphate/5'-hydroxy nucleic acid ligase n=1 Tax=Chitinophaga horti TaxID=2920382 RepID=A0ABY6IYI4_9BACT|nr:RtcB family protein [Chitinophaga horti]UYQ92442.1 RtcB family protein [Chitinophaga horti]